MLTLLQNSLNDFKKTYHLHLTIAFIFMLLSSFLFVPVISFIFNRLLLMRGSSSLINAEVYQIGLSYTGFAGLIFICFIAVIVLFIEFGIFIIIAQKGFLNKDVSMSESFITMLSKIPKLLGFGVFPFIFLMLLIIPFIESQLLSTIIELNIPFVLDSHVYASYYSMGLYVFIVMLVVYLILRWIFTLHYTIIEGKSLWKAMQSSFFITKGNTMKILFSLFLMNVSIFVVSYLIMTFISAIPSVMERNIIGYLIDNYIVTFTSFVAVLLALLLIPLNIIILTRLFFQLNNKHQGHLEDHLHTYGSQSLGRYEQKAFRFFKTKKYLVLALLMIYLASIYVLNYGVQANIVYLDWNVSVAAHRGDPINAPENSLSSVRSAMEQGVDAVEIDVQMTTDGVVVLHHDVTLDRLADIPRTLTDMTYAEISDIDIGIKFDTEFAGEPITTLEAVMQEVQDEDVKLLIDFKPYNDTGEALATRVVQLIEQYEMEDVSYVQAFDYDALQVVRQLNPEIKIGQIMYIAAGNLSALDVDFYSINQSMLSNEFIRKARRDNREVWVWTVNTEENIRHVLSYNIDGIITDYPQRFHQIIGFGLMEKEE